MMRDLRTKGRADLTERIMAKAVEDEMVWMRRTRGLPRSQKVCADIAAWHFVQEAERIAAVNEWPPLPPQTWREDPSWPS